MATEKSWYLSKTIWGSLIAVAALAFGGFGIDIAPADQEQIAEALVQLTGAAGALLAIYGRLTATEVIG